MDYRAAELSASHEAIRKDCQHPDEWQMGELMTDILGIIPMNVKLPALSWNVIRLEKA